MTEYSYAITLRIRHASRDLSEIGSTLDIAPTRVWRVGEKRTTPTGRPLKGTNRESYWYSELLRGESSVRPISDAFDEMIEKLELHAAFFQELSSDGGGVELFVGWFFPDGSSGDVFGHSLLARLSVLKIDLCFDIYPDMQYSDAPTAW